MNSRFHRLAGKMGIAVALLVGTASAVPAADSAAPKRLPRSECFLGIHFDFHANTDCKEVGKNTTSAMVNRIIDLVGPDYLQIDCKGHPGYSSYPTKVGHQAPGIIGDPLRIWRDVTAARGVGLYMHYSGVWDGKAVAEHPDWAVTNADGKPNTRATSFFGPYAEKLLIPQLRELASVYSVDGAWIDGECWASQPDYSDAAIAAFRKATGITSIPRKSTDPHYFEFLEFHREQFRTYLRHYIAEVKKTNPNFQICSNWAYTDHMAEPVSAPLDFLSGDYSPQDSVNSARLSARYLARQGKAWDLMAWSFTTKPTRDQKSAIQLQREAAVVLALGGGFQAYFKQKRDGSIYDEQIPVMAEVAKFCRARQAVVHRAVPVPQIALLLSTPDHYRRLKGLFPRDLSHIQGTLNALLESQHSVEVVGEHQIAGRLSDYPLIVLPECQYLEPAFRDSLLAYVKSGGTLLLLGPTCARLFQQEIGLTLDGEPQAGASVQLAHAGKSVDFKTTIQQPTLQSGAKSFGQLRVGNAAYPAASIVTLGQGRIASTYFACGKVYQMARLELVRQFLSDLTRELFPSPLVEVRGSGVDVCVARNHGKLLVNLVNTSGPHQTDSIQSSISPVGPVDITVRLGQPPASVTLEPGARSIATHYRDGQLRLNVPKVDIHDILVIQPR